VTLNSNHVSPYSEMTDDEHKQLAVDFYRGKLLFGFDRNVARKFFMDTSVRSIEDQTGEAPRVESFVVWALLVGGHIALITSLLLSVIVFEWWSALVIPVSVLVYVVFMGLSSLPKHGMLGISVIVVAFMGTFAMDVFPSRTVGLYFVFISLALWLARCVYFAAFHFVRAFALRNKKAFEILASHINLRPTNEG